jgi:two-component system sensor histidine kinase YesM
MKHAVWPAIKSIRTRFIVLFLVFLIPLYSIGFGIYLFGRNSIAQSVRESQANRTEFYMESLFAEINRIQRLQFDFFQDIYLMRLTEAIRIMSNYERDMGVINIQNRLKTILNSSRDIDNITVSVPPTGRRFYAGNIIRYSGAGDQNTGLDTAYFDFLDSLLVPSVYCTGGKLLLHAATSRGYDPESPGKYKYHSEVELSEMEIIAAMGELLQEGENFICYWADNEDFFYTSLEYFPPEYEKNVIANTMDDKKAAGLTLDGKKYQAYRTSLAGTSLVYISLMDEKIFYRPINTFLMLFLLFSVAALFSIALFSGYFGSAFYLPLSRLKSAFGELESGNFSVKIEYQKQDEFLNLYEGFNQMVAELKQLIHQLYHQKLLVQKAELRQLQAQINPHFLFNCFFTLSRRIKSNDIDGARDMTAHLGEFFQYITRNAQETVNLGEELQHARIYARIQISRFSSRLSMLFGELPPEYHTMIVDRLIIQPIIENAFEHGLKNKEKNGMLRVVFEGHGDSLAVSIEDNGDELRDDDIERLNVLVKRTDDEFAADSAEITGLVNIHRRIVYRMGKGAGLGFTRGESGGLMVTMTLRRIPCIPS